MKRDEIIEKIWAVYVMLLMTAFCLGTGYFLFTREPEDPIIFKWIIGCILFGTPPQFIFLMLLTVFKKK